MHLCSCFGKRGNDMGGKKVKVSEFGKEVCVQILRASE